MQTPQGFEIIDGRVVPVGLAEGHLQSLLPYRLVHMTLAAYLATALFVAASGAWHLMKGHRTPAIRTMFSMALWMLLFTAPLQILAAISTDSIRWSTSGQDRRHGRPLGAHAREAVPLILFGWPDMAAETTRWAVEVPHLGSLILTHSWDGQIPALKDFPPEDRPNSTVIFWTFRIMVGLGMLMLALGALGLLQRLRGKLYDSVLLQRFASSWGRRASSPSLPGGSPRRWAVSPMWSMASCARRMRSPTIRRWR